MKSTFHKTLALAISVSLLAAYTPGVCARPVIEEDTTVSGTYADANISGHGGAFFVNHGTLTVETSTFTNNRVTGAGGAIVNLDELVVNNSTFNENLSQNQGGAIYNNANANTTISNSTFTGNQSSNNWAGSIANFGTLTIDNSTFTGNTAAGYGGAIYDYGSATITNSSFSNNIANAGSGGAIYEPPKGTVLHISGSSFDNNHAIYDGGALAPYKAYSIANSTFENNTAQLTQDASGAWTQISEDSQQIGGGAIALGAESTGSITGSTFKNNISGQWGGAIGTRRGADANNSGAKLDIAATFQNNEAYQEGGAIYNAFYANNDLGHGDGVTVTGAFSGNYAHKNGGAIYNAGETDKAGHAAVMTVYNTTFTGNKADENGGAIYNGGTLTLAGTNTFTGNTAAEGADIYNTGVLTINDTTTLDGGIDGNGSVTVNGTLNIGQAKVKAGTLVFANGSTLGVEFGNDTAGELTASTVTVGENAADTANLQVTLSKDFLTTDTTQHTLTDATVQNGKFVLTNVSNALYNVSFDDTTNVVTTQRKSQEEQKEAVEQAGGTSNDTVVIAAYTSASDLGNDTTNKVADIINQLAQTDTVAAVAATKAVAPEVAPAKQVVQTAVLGEVFGAIQNRMTATTSSAPATYALGDAKDYQSADTENFSVWTQGLLNKSHKEATSQAGAFTGRSTGIAFGADMHVGEDGLVGAGYAYTHTNVSSTGRHNRILGDTFFLYGQYRPSAFYVQGSVAYGDSKYEEKKYLPGLTLGADYHVQSYSAQALAGYDVTDWLSPNMGLRYTRLHQEGYNDGAQTISAENANYLTAMLGSTFQMEKRLSQHVSLLPHLYTGLAYDLVSDDNNSRVTLPNSTGYNVTGERLHRLSFEVGAGFTARIYQNIEAVAAYEGSFREDYNSHTGTLKLRYLF